MRLQCSRKRLRIAALRASFLWLSELEFDSGTTSPRNYVFVHSSSSRWLLNDTKRNYTRLSCCRVFSPDDYLLRKFTTAPEALGPGLRAEEGVHLLPKSKTNSPLSVRGRTMESFSTHSIVLRHLRLIWSLFTRPGQGGQKPHMLRTRSHSGSLHRFRLSPHVAPIPSPAFHFPIEPLGGDPVCHFLGSLRRLPVLPDMTVDFSALEV